jgi:hypothetical protein
MNPDRKPDIETLLAMLILAACASSAELDAQTVLANGGVAALPAGPGLAAAFPGDAGIVGHADVLFSENFEGFSGDGISWAEMGDWDNVYGDLLITRTGSNVNHGSQALLVTHIQPRAHGAVKEVAGYDTLFVRYYMKVHARFPGCHHTGMYVRGGQQNALWDNPTGRKPTGVDHFIAGFDCLSPLHDWDPPENDTPPGWAYCYCYHMDQAGGYGDVILPGGLMDGSYPFAEVFTPRPNVTPQRDRWTCYEIMVQCNTPGERNGRVGLWIDGGTP